MRALRDESGQVIALVGVVMVVLLAMCALVIDVGSWYVKSRQTQNAADAAALAAAQDLPSSPSAADADAASYAQTDGAALAGEPVISSTAAPNDTITAHATATAPSTFARLFGIGSVTVDASATAQAAGISSVQGPGSSTEGTGEAVPFAVSDAQWQATPLGQPTTLSYGPDAAVGPGQFGLVDLSQGGGGKSPQAIAASIGPTGTLATGTYPAIPGNKFNAAALKSAIESLAGKTVIVPVYTTPPSGGSGSTYTVVGWAAFAVGDAEVGGASTTLTGSFVRLDVSTPGPPARYFGVGSVKLTG